MPNWEELDELQLLDKAQNGDTEAFGEVYSRYAGMVFRYLYAHLEDRLDAEDLTIEVFLKTWRSMVKYRQQGIPFSAFLFRVAKNVLVDFYRRSASLKNAFPVEEISEHSALLADPAGEVSNQVEHRELIRQLHRLKEDYRLVLALRFIAGLSPDETAQVMHRSVGAIRILQFRALGALRSLLEEG